MLILICHDTWHIPKSVIPGPLLTILILRHGFKTIHIVKKKRFSFYCQMSNVMILPRLVRLLDHPQVTMKLVNGSSLDCSTSSSLHIEQPQPQNRRSPTIVVGYALLVQH